MNHVSSIVVSLCLWLTSGTTLACEFIAQMGYDAERRFPSHVPALCEVIERFNDAGVPAIVSADDDDCDDGDPTWIPREPYAVYVSARGVFLQQLPKETAWEARELIDSFRNLDIRIGKLSELGNDQDIDRLARIFRNNSSQLLWELKDKSLRSGPGIYYLVVPSSRY